MTRVRRKPASVPAAATPAVPIVHAVQTDGSFWREAIGIFLVALGVRLIHVWQIRASPFFSILMGDALGYDTWAQRIAHGDWIGTDVFYQAPLYPYFLGTIYAVAGRHLLLVRICQAIVGSAACGLLGLTASRLFSRSAGIVAGGALALYAPAVFFDGLIQKSVLDVFFICLMLWITAGIISRPDRVRSWLWLGLATGGLSLTRENALVFVVVIIAFASMQRPAGVAPALRRASLFVAGLAIVLLPVAIRNHAVGGGFYLTTSQFGPNFFIGNNPRADGTYRSLRPGRGAPEFERQDATELAEQATGHSLTPAEVSGYWTDRALAFVTSEPGSWLKLVGRKLILLTNAAEMIDTESQESYAEWSAPVRWGAWFGHFGLLVPLALFGAFVVWPAKERIWVFYAMTIVYAASLLLFYVFARYRYPMVPLLLLFASAGIADAARFMRVSSAGQKTAALVVVVGGLVLANWPLGASAGLPQAVTENNLGLALQGAGRVDEATTHYQRAIAFRPDYAPAYNNVAQALRAQGRHAEAIAAFKRAVAVAPGYPDSHYNFGVELEAQGDHRGAVEQFREYIRLGPDEGNAIAANNMIGLSLLAEGKPDEAAAAFRESLARQPSNIDALGGLGDVLMKQGRFEESARAFREYVARVPGNAVAFHNLGLALVREDKEEAALDPFGRAAALQPGNAGFHQDLGTALAAVGRLDEAVASFRRALELAPERAGIHDSLAVALAAQGHVEEALAHFRRAAELEPGNPQIRMDMEAAMRQAK